jgi:hypothetical protein
MFYVLNLCRDKILREAIKNSKLVNAELTK